MVGALGPKMSMLAGEVADGVLFNWMTPAHIAHLAPTVHGSLMAYVRCALLPRAEARLSAELERYSGLAQYEKHLARMHATALDTCVVGPEGAALQPGLARFEAVLDETIVRAITADDSLDSLVELARACAPGDGLRRATCSRPTRAIAHDVGHVNESGKNRGWSKKWMKLWPCERPRGQNAWRSR